MTIEVLIKHNQPGYACDIKVTPVYPDGTRMGEVYSKVVRGGETVSMYVHSRQSLLIEELPPTNTY